MIKDDNIRSILQTNNNHNNSKCVKGQTGCQVKLKFKEMLFSSTFDQHTLVSIPFSFLHIVSIRLLSYLKCYLANFLLITHFKDTFKTNVYKQIRYILNIYVKPILSNHIVLIGFESVPVQLSHLFKHDHKALNDYKNMF